MKRLQQSVYDLIKNYGIVIKKKGNTAPAFSILLLSKAKKSSPKQQIGGRDYTTTYTYYLSEKERSKAEVGTVLISKTQEFIVRSVEEIALKGQLLYIRGDLQTLEREEE